MYFGPAPIYIFLVPQAGAWAYVLAKFVFILPEYTVESKQDYENFLRAHAKNSMDGFWLVTTPIKAFKKVRTYPESQDKNIVLHPHYSDDKEKKALSAVHNNRYYDTDAWEYRGAIINLLIPEGAHLFMNPYLYPTYGDYGKLRSSKAIVHSIVRVTDKKPVAFGVSKWDNTFVYLNPQMTGRSGEVTPKKKFSAGLATCCSGIHFFLELDAALRY
jgi:hypothetical protein